MIFYIIDLSQTFSGAGRKAQPHGQMRTTPFHIYSLFFLLLLYHDLLHTSHAQPAPNTTGYTCTAAQTPYPCQTYAYYQATSPNFTDLASVGDLFSVSRLMISKPSNISSPSTALVAGQPLFVPLTCSCNSVNTSIGNISYANISYTINGGDTFFLISTNKFQNLTTYQSVEAVNPTLVATNLTIGVNAIFPVFCKCPNRTQLQNQVNYLVSYVFQPSDNLSSVASRFGVQQQSIIDVNGDSFQPFNTIFIPVTQLPQLSQPAVAPSPPPASPPPVESDQRKGVVTGLAIGLGIAGFLLILLIAMWVHRERVIKKRKSTERDEENQRQLLGKGAKGLKEKENLMADVSDCLDKYRMFKIEELMEATDEFSESSLIQGSVYKGSIDGEVFAIKKMKWNAYEELKILQKVKLLFFSYGTVFTFY